MDERLHRAPFGVVGKVEVLTVAVHHALLHLRGVESAAAAAAAATTATTATTTSAATTTATAAGLRVNLSGAQQNCGSHASQCQH